MVNKRWFPNPEETGMGIVNLIQKADMIESMKIEQND